MSSAVEQEEGLELANLEHIRLERALQELDASPSTAVDAYQLAQNLRFDRYPTSVDSTGDQYVQSSTSLNRRSSREGIDPSSRQVTAMLMDQNTKDNSSLNAMSRTTRISRLPSRLRATYHRALLIDQVSSPVITYRRPSHIDATSASTYFNLSPMRLRLTLAKAKAACATWKGNRKEIELSRITTPAPRRLDNPINPRATTKTSPALTRANRLSFRQIVPEYCLSTT